MRGMRLATAWVRGPLFVLAMTAGVSNAQTQDTRELLTAELRLGEATMWYLGHAGWAVKTRDHLLIFDYWESSEPESDRSLSRGYVDPTEIADQDVYVFVSHNHGDHYDSVILEWQQSIPNVTYVFGWGFSTDSRYVCLKEPREARQFDGLEVATINHDFDGIPESAFIIRVDGLVIYHSGDHGTWSDPPNSVFTGNIDYAAARYEQIDIAFISTFGQRGGGSAINAGDRYSIEVFKPSVMFPMHHGGNEDQYEKFAREIRREDVETVVHYASRPGDRFTYKDGRVERQ